MEPLTWLFNIKLNLNTFKAFFGLVVSYLVFYAGHVSLIPTVDILFELLFYSNHYISEF